MSGYFIIKLLSGINLGKKKGGLAAHLLAGRKMEKKLQIN